MIAHGLYFLARALYRSGAGAAFRRLLVVVALGAYLAYVPLAYLGLENKPPRELAVAIAAPVVAAGVLLLLARYVLYGRRPRVVILPPSSSRR